jgi:hypothetical protein
MESVWWVIFIVAIVFYTLRVAGAFRKSNRPPGGR